ncbi:MAG: amino acid ABC transporter substrate-binding protein [Geminicoccaceae bacterium]
MRFKTLLLAGAAVSLLGASQVSAGETLDNIREKGFIQCGVNGSGLAGFGVIGDNNEYVGMDIDVCKAVAASLLGDPEAVKYTGLTAKERFTALQSGEVDLLSRNTTWTASRDTALGLDFVGVTYYDGQGFMVPKELGVRSALELDGASVCVQTGTTTELNLADYFRANNMQFEGVVFESTDELIPAFVSGRCDVFTTDASGLYAERTKFENPDDYMVLPEIISKEPLGPAVRHGDDEWADIARWTVYALIEAEELGITQDNIEEMKESTNPSIRRLLGVEGEIGEGLGLDADWAAKAIAAVGNYGEIFERNVGAETPLGIDRGLNRLWTDGGLIYAMPIR